MTRSELILRISDRQKRMVAKDVEWAVKEILERLSLALSNGKRVEVRGFGSFSLHYRAPRMGRNPRTGQPVKLDEKYVPHFKPGKGLRLRIDRQDSTE